MVRFRLVGCSLVLVGALVAGWFHFAASAPSNLKVVFLDVGQGDSAVVRTPSGKTVVVDTGPITAENDAGRKVVLPFLRSQGIQHLDAIILSHPDDDHVGGTESILERIPVSRLIMPIGMVETPLSRHILETARSRDVKIETLARGQTISFRDGAAMTVLAPSPMGLPKCRHADNNNSLVLRLTDGDTSILFTGDAEEEEEADIMANSGDLRTEVLKAGHHGSKNASSDCFLNAVQPEAAVISVGRRNIFGHPHPDTLARFGAHGVRVFRTDRQGAVTVTSDGRNLKITTEK